MHMPHKDHNDLSFQKTSNEFYGNSDAEIIEQEITQNSEIDSDRATQASLYPSQPQPEPEEHWLKNVSTQEIIPLQIPVNLMTNLPT